MQFNALSESNKIVSNESANSAEWLMIGGSERICGLHLSANLVMLSACVTGLSSISSGDDVVGLTRGFLYAGAQNVVGSLWEVDDDATAELSRLMYAAMKKGVPVAKSLADAQEQLMRKKPHPYFWAAFMDSGTGR